MKKCNDCKLEIDSKAKRCPHCQADQRSWPARHPIWTGLGILILIGFVTSAVNGGKSDGQKVETSTTATTQTEQKTEQKTIETFKIGDAVDLDGKTVMVNGIAPYTVKNQFMEPKEGNKMVSVDVTLGNNSGEAFNYNVLNFRLQDDKDFTYNNAVSDQQPYLTVGAIQAGEKVRGFITYEIPTDNTPSKFLFTPGFISTKQVIIDLTN